MKNNIPFSPPYIDEDVLSEVKSALESGWITTGPKVKALEIEISKLSQVDHALCLNSATSGLMIALKWFGIGPGDEVILPAYTYSATALAVYHIGAKPILVDVKPDFTIDPVKIKKAITTRTKAIIPVDIAGWPADYDEIIKIITEDEIVKKFRPSTKEQKTLDRILILSDAAHSLGATYKNRPIGQTADLTVFSLHAVKNITTAEGGAICIKLPNTFNNEEIYTTMRLMSLNGQTKDAYTKTKAGGWRYDIVLPGFKMNMPDICAAIGLAQIKKYKRLLLPERKRIALDYEIQFKKYSWAELPLIENSGTQTSYHIYPLRIKNISEAQRDLIIENITKNNISVNVHFIPLPMLSFFKTLGYDIKDFPVSFNNYSREISLPIYPQLTSAQVNMIVKTVVDSYNLVVK
ncbi:MAG: DegT/DnrJ/EryC1/StrS family aminotransferase [Tenuifilaceae bacterium]